jgi:ABC-type dipeptide/oligopeptide/nickel transport system permease component
MKHSLLVSVFRFFVTVGMTCLLMFLLLRLWPNAQQSRYSAAHELTEIFINGGRSFIVIALALAFSCGFTAFSLLFARRFHRPGLGIKSCLYILSSIPTIFVGYLVQDFFRQRLGIDLLLTGVDAGKWQYYLIPALVLGVGDGFLNEFIQHAGGEVEAIRRENYLRMAKALGASGGRMWGYIKNDLLVRSSRVMLSRVTALISGTVVVEKIFGISGLGGLAFNAAERGHILTIMLILFCMVIVVSLLNLVYRIIAVILDPRLR